MRLEEQTIINQFTNLLIRQYNSKPNAIATITIFVKTLLANGLLSQVQTCFDLETAIGVQLDTTAKYIGVNRNYTLGILSDADFRQLILFKIILNYSSGSFASINNSLFQFFGTDITFSTANDMNMTYYVILPNAVLQAVLDQNLLPTPMGVGQNIIQHKPEEGFFLAFVDADNLNGASNYSIGFADGDIPTSLNDGKLLDSDTDIIIVD